MNKFDVVPMLVLALFLFVLGYLLGVSNNVTRFYNNCIEANASMITKDAVAKCKEMIAK